MKTNQPVEPSTVLQISLAPDKISKFLSLFTAGVLLPVQIGGTLEELICDQLGVSKDYFESRVQTIFLNFKAVDAPEKAVVNDNAAVTLSAAMPGLVGATMRKGGTLAGFRSGISCAQDEECEEATKGTITLKLLNMVARELGPTFLEKGVYLTGDQLAVFLAEADSGLQDDCREIVLDGNIIGWQQMSAEKWDDRMVLLHVHAETSITL